MKFSDLLTMISGLSLFLYGMYLMGEGLSGASGGVLERVLTKLTDSSGKAVLVGTGATAVLQSSSAVTVMVVGLADSGVMGLRQAAGVIMGANIGTTVTSWILSLAGPEDSSPLARMLRPTYFSAVPAMVGVALLLGARGDKTRTRHKDTASVLVGFAVLMFGMDAMSGAVRPLASMPRFVGMLTAFSHPFLGVLAGAAVTAVIQSSSASIGILQALCASGTVSYGAAIPIIMGQNIGTCVTALLSTVGAGRNAKRTALIHLYFNGIGTALFMAFFYVAHSVFSFDFIDKAASGAGIAAIHSIFNVAATAALFPFSDGLVRLACLSVGGEMPHGWKSRAGSRGWKNHARCFLDRRGSGWYSDY